MDSLSYTFDPPPSIAAVYAPVTAEVQRDR
jgi:hypothetical protein